MGCRTRLCILLCLLLPGCATNPDQRPICEVHGLALLDDEVPILYGYVLFRACDLDPRTPHVDDYAVGGCRWYGQPKSGPAMAPVKYCPRYRRATGCTRRRRRRCHSRSPRPKRSSERAPPPSCRVRRSAGDLTCSWAAPRAPSRVGLSVVKLQKSCRWPSSFKLWRQSPDALIEIGLRQNLGALLVRSRRNSENARPGGRDEYDRIAVRRAGRRELPPARPVTHGPP